MQKLLQLMVGRKSTSCFAQRKVPKFEFHSDQLSLQLHVLGPTNERTPAAQVKELDLITFYQVKILGNHIIEQVTFKIVP